MDENVNPVFRTALLRQEPRQVEMPGAPALGTLDPEILLWCEENEFILVTNNRASMPVHLQDHLAEGWQAMGIFILNDEMRIGETVEELRSQ
jgi:hypothetical protein